MSSADEYLSPLMAEEDVAVRRSKHRTTLWRVGRRVLVVKGTLPNVLPHARRSGLAGGAVELNASAQQNARSLAANTRTKKKHSESKKNQTNKLF